MLEKWEFFVSAFAPFLHKLLREGSWVVDVQAGKETTTKRDTGSGREPRADDWVLGTWSWRFGAGCPGSWACPEGWEGLSVLW